MVAGFDNLLEEDVFNGEMGHAAKHNAVNDQVNFLTEQLGPLVGGSLEPEKRVFVTPRGDDANDGLSLAKAFATIGAALTALGGTPGLIELGYGTITENLTWGTVPDGTVIRGSGKTATTIRHDFNGDLASLGQQVKISDLTIDGRGATRTGRCFYFDDAKGKQTLADVNLKDWDGYCLEFHPNGGSQFLAVGLDVNRTAAGTGTGRYAIKISDTQQLAATPRTFIGLQTQGQCAIDFGGCNNVYVVASTLGDLRFTADSRAVNISASRWLNQAAATIDGHNNAIVGCDIAPALTIAAGADSIVIGPNTYNNLPITDNSGNDRNQIHHHQITYATTVETTGTATVLGNGTVSARYVRHGAAVTVHIKLTVGSTTAFGTGALRFLLPFARISGNSVTGTWTIFDASAGTFYTGACLLLSASNQVQLCYGGAPYVTPTAAAPAILATGDTVDVSITFGL